MTVLMTGALIPDIYKIRLLVSGWHVGAVLDLPFSWVGISTAGGALVFVLIGVIIAEPSDRARVAGLLSIGAGSHLFTDALLRTPTWHSYAVLWPLTRYHPPTPGLYLSTDPWLPIVTGGVALLIWGLHRSWMSS